MKIGFIGQGFIGKNYADDFENRGYEVVRYAREDKYAGSKDEIKNVILYLLRCQPQLLQRGLIIVS